MRSASVRNLAVSGKSWMMKNESAPATTVASPSMMKIHAHAGLPPTPSKFEIAACEFVCSGEQGQVTVESRVQSGGTR